MRSKNLSIKFKLTSITLATCAIVLVVACAAVFISDIWAMQNDLAEELLLQADIIGNNSTATLTFDDSKSAREVLSALRADAHISGAALYDAKGAMFAEYIRPGSAVALPEQPPLEGSSGRSNLMLAVRRIHLDNETIGTILLVSDTTKIAQRIEKYLWFSAAIFFFALALAFLLTVRLQRVVSRPILQLAETARKVSTEKNFMLRAEKDSDDEVGTLIDSFNGMLEQIHQRDDQLLKHREHLEEEVATRIRELKRTNEQLLVAKERAEQGSRAKSEFLANMSHEIRTPLNGVIGMTELALDTELTPEQLDYLSTARNSAETLLTVINDILDFSKVEAGKLELETIDFNIRDLVDETIRPISVLADQKGVELLSYVGHDVPEGLIGDPGRLRQVLTNLMSNAVKFTHEGEIELSVHLAKETVDSARLMFCVRDTGIGIAEDKQRLVFEAFTQADGSTTRQYGGTGLGLTICSRLVHMMGGAIALESTPGSGSRFFFEAQFGRQKVQTRPNEAADRPDLRERHVLIIDDNATNRRILSDTVRNWGMRPVVSENGAAGLERLVHCHPAIDIVLLDCDMPELDGFEVARRIQEETSLRPAILMLTSSSNRGDSARCKAVGISAYLIKPVRQNDLLAAISASLTMGKAPPKPELITRHSLREDRRRLKILLAEDNAINQKLASRLLEKWGHAVRLADTGGAAVRAYDSETFDLICMDVQMPEMSGYEATAHIRERERLSGIHTPILAMTAHAMRGDREKCFEAGMDAYISKPLDATELFQIIDQLVKPRPLETRTSDSFSAGLLLERTGGDAQLAVELAETFIEQWPEMLGRLQAAIDRKDPGAVCREAHSIKGAVSIFGCSSLTDALDALEANAAAGLSGASGPALPFIQIRASQLSQSLRDAVEGGILAGQELR